MIFNVVFRFMKLLTNFFSSAATKRPVITILVVVLLTGFFGYMAGQSEELSTSFGGELDTPEIQAQSKLGEYFQTSGSQSVFQIIVSGEAVSYTHLTLPTKVRV